MKSAMFSSASMWFKFIYLPLDLFDLFDCLVFLRFRRSNSFRGIVIRPSIVTEFTRPSLMARYRAAGVSFKALAAYPTVTTSEMVMLMPAHLRILLNSSQGEISWKIKLDRIQAGV